MAKGLSLSIGLNAVDPKHYGGWAGELNACEAHAAEMSALAKAQGFRPTVLLTRRATRARVQAELGKAARQLVLGVRVLAYSDTRHSRAHRHRRPAGTYLDAHQSKETPL